MLLRRHYSITNTQHPYSNTQRNQKTPNISKKQKSLSPLTKNIKHNQNCQTNYNYLQEQKILKTPQTSAKRGAQTFSTPFVSVYARETRLDHIMKIKIKPALGNSKQYHLAIGEKQNSQLVVKKAQKSRLQQIMALKVNKPKIGSTLLNYQPKTTKRQSSPSEKQRSEEEQTLFQAQLKYKKLLQIEQRQDKRWKNQQKQRQTLLKQKQKQEQKQYNEQRRKEVLFENMVEKQMKKIQKQRQVSERKNGGFAIYVYSCY